MYFLKFCNFIVCILTMHEIIVSTIYQSVAPTCNKRDDHAYKFLFVVKSMLTI